MFKGFAASLMAVAVAIPLTQASGVWAMAAGRESAPLDIANGAPGIATGSSFTGVGSPAAATLPEVRMVCEVGQTDINWASVSELKASLKVDKPVAQRVVSWRPYLAPKDLSVVEGIGPDKLAAILTARKVCATPTSYPLPAPNACIDTKVDLAVASSTELGTRLGITNPIAERIIEARPYASLRHVTPERVGGVGKGTLDQVIAKSCLTPAPARTSSSSWRWAYSSQTTTTTRDSFALTVPGGVIDGSGGWASITPVDHSVTADTPFGPLVTGDAPTADFHIWADWADGIDEVTVQLPQDVILADNPDWEPLLIHHLDDGTTDGAWGTEVAWNQGAGTVSTQQTSLSETESSSFDANWLLEKGINLVFGGRTDQPTCPNQWDHQANSSWYENPAYHDLASVDSWMLQLPGSPSLFGSYPFKHCLGSIGGANSDVDTLLANNLRGMTAVRPLNGSTAVIKQEDLTEFVNDPIGSILAEVLHDANPSTAYLIPGAKAKFGTAIRDASQVDATVERSLTMAWFLAKEIFDAAWDAGLGKLDVSSRSRTELKIFLGCFKSVAGVLNDDVATLGSLVQAVSGCVDPGKLIDLMQADLSQAFREGKLAGSDFNNTTSELKKVQRAVKWLKLGEATITLVDTLAWSSLPDQTISVYHYPAKPNFFNGYPVRSACLSQDTVNYTWIVDQECQDRFYAPGKNPPSGSGTPGTAYPAGVILRDYNGAGNWLYLYPENGELTGRTYQIPSGANYVCLAKHYVVDWAPETGGYWTPLNRTFLNAYPCNAADAGVNLAANGGLDTDFRLLREPDGLNAINKVWLPWTSTGRAEVPSANEFSCLVDPQPRQLNGGVWLNPPKYLVWDLVDPSIISALRPDEIEYSFSFCTDGF